VSVCLPTSTLHRKRAGHYGRVAYLIRALFFSFVGERLSQLENIDYFAYEFDVSRFVPNTLLSETFKTLLSFYFGNVRRSLERSSASASLIEKRSDSVNA